MSKLIVKAITTAKPENIITFFAKRCTEYEGETGNTIITYRG